MVIRLRFRRGPKVAKKRNSNRQVALAMASLLTPAALMALALALWRLGMDLQITGPFAIKSGFFSHWQVWIGASIALFAAAALLNRYGRALDRHQQEPVQPSLFETAPTEK